MNTPTDTNAVNEAVEYIRDSFGTMREAFLSDPGGYLAVADAPMTDEVASEAIDIIEKEWTRSVKTYQSGVLGTVTIPD